MISKNQIFSFLEKERKKRKKKLNILFFIIFIILLLIYNYIHKIYIELVLEINILTLFNSSILLLRNSKSEVA